MKSPLPYVGGKWTCLPHIEPRLPLKSQKFVEPFGGGANIILYRKRANVEIYNDLDNNVFNFFHVVKFLPHSFNVRLDLLNHCSPQNFKMLTEIVYGNPNYDDYLKLELESAEKLFEGEQLEIVKRELDEKFRFSNVDKAVAYLLLKKISYASGGKTYTPTIVNVEAVKIDVERTSKRLEQIALENRDFRKIFKSHDGKDTFFYIDPPYFGTERMYTNIFGLIDHEDLFRILGNLEGKFLLSYNDCEYIRELAKQYGFYIYAYERPNAIALKYDKENKFPEILIANYDMDEMMYQNTKQLSMSI